MVHRIFSFPFCPSQFLLLLLLLLKYRFPDARWYILYYYEYYEIENDRYFIMLTKMNGDTRKASLNDTSTIYIIFSEEIFHLHSETKL